EDDLSHVFDKYARRGQTSEGQTGIELGLTLVRATVEAHRGTVVAQNLDQQGVVFTITLPATLRLTPAMNEEPSGRD
ncbi:MAG: ATP-binding protein, partial [Chloroflexota bacterium]